MFPHPFALIILDGFGSREASPDNAIAAAHTPTFDRLYQDYPHTLISGSGLDVGLPGGQMGNSEVGHVNLGAGRVVYQELTRIDKAIADGSFDQNPVINIAIALAQSQQKRIHILGLLSPGGVHSSEEHIWALMKLCAKNSTVPIFLHAFLDGRDTPPKSAKASLETTERLCQQLKTVHIATLCGRYFAMDRDQRWDRLAQAYALLTQNQASWQAQDALSGLQAAYDRGESDEFLSPTLITPNSQVQAGDVVIFMNFRADRARQLTHALLDIPLSTLVTLTEYEKGLPVQVAYTPQALDQVLGEVLAENHLTQLRIAETEKYAHVTFFFNGGREAPFPGEDRILVPSPKVATYDLKPEMSAIEVTDQLVAAITSQRYAAIICNFANADMVGHTGNFSATVAAIETLDDCLKRILDALARVDGECLITADHGNAEKMRDETTGQAHTAHTSDPVPLIYVGRPAQVMVTDGVLSDIAPTMLGLMGLTIPKAMTGRQIFKLDEAK